MNPTTNPTATRAWKSHSGLDVRASITLELSKDIDADGDRVTVECCEMSDVIADVSGHPRQYVYERLPKPRAVKDMIAVARIGNLALDADQAAIVDSMIAEIEAHPAWIAKQERIRKNQNEIREMEANRTRNGYCRKCGSYCHGDCEA